MYNTLQDYRKLYPITKNCEEVKVTNEKAPALGEGLTKPKIRRRIELTVMKSLYYDNHFRCVSFLYLHKNLHKIKKQDLLISLKALLLLSRDDRT